MNANKNTVVASMMMVAALIITGGCLSTLPGSSNFADVVIEGASIQAIRNATERVFSADHYTRQSSGEGNLVFVRDGTSQDKLRYGRYGETLFMRVEVALEPHGVDSILVRADAYAVRGDSGFDTQKLLKMVRGPYQDLLDSVKETLLKSRP